MDRKKGIRLCICGMCPSFVDCKEEIAYCLAETGNERLHQGGTGMSLPGMPCTGRGEFPACLLLHPGKRTGQSHAR